MAAAGAPRSGWKLTSQGPSTVARFVRTGVVTWRDCVAAGRRNTTNTASHGSRCNGTVVRPVAIVNAAGS